MFGQSANLTVSSASIVVNAGASANLYGSYNTLTEAANSGAYVGIDGVHDTLTGDIGSNFVNLLGAGSSATVDGSVGLTAASQSATVTNANALITVAGAGDAVSGSTETVAVNAGDSANLYGSYNTLTEAANSGAYVGIDGVHDTLTGDIGSNSVNLLGAGSSATVDGSIGLTAANQSVTLTGINALITVAGAGDAVSGSTETVAVNAGDSANLYGSYNTLTEAANSGAYVGIDGVHDTLTGDNGSNSVNLLGAGSSATVDGSIGLTAANQSVTLTGINALITVAGAGDAVSGSTETVAVNAGDSANLYGSYNTLTEAANSGAYVGIDGVHDSLTGDNGSNSVNLLGAGSSATVDGSIGLTAANQSVTLTGINALITVAGAGDAVSGSTETVAVNAGDSANLYGSYNTLTEAANSGAYVGIDGVHDSLTGDNGSNSVNLLGAGSSATVDGSVGLTAASQSVTLTGINALITVAGAGDAVSGSTETVAVNAGDSANLYGSYNTLTEAANSGAYVGITGVHDSLTGDNGSNSVNLLGAGSSATVDGSIGLTAANQSVTVTNANALITVAGAGDAVSGSTETVAVNAGDSANLYGSYNTLTEAANSGAYVGIDGVHDSLTGDNGSNSVNLLGAGSSATVDGSVGLTAASQSVTLTGINALITVAGAGDAVSGSTETVAVNAGDSANLYGSYNTLTEAANSGAYVGIDGVHDSLTGDNGSNSVNLLGAGSSATVDGSIGLTAANQSVTLTGINALITVAGAADAVSGSTETVAVNAGDSANLYGSYNTLTEAANSGAYVGIDGVHDTLTGDNGSNSVNLLGAGSSATVDGSIGLTAANQSVTLTKSGIVENIDNNGDAVTGSNDSVAVASGMSATLNGANNSATLVTNSNSFLTLNGIGDSVTSQTNNITLSGSNTSLTVTGSGNSFAMTGSNDALTVYETDLATGVSQEINDYTGGNGTVTHTLRLFNLTDGSSEKDQYNPSSGVSDQYTDYSGANETGSITQTGYFNTNGTSQTTFYNPYGPNSISKLIVNYNSSNVAISGAATYTNGSSANINYVFNSNGAINYQQVTYYSASGSSYGYENYNASDQAIGGTYNNGAGDAAPPDNEDYLIPVTNDDFTQNAPALSGNGAKPNVVAEYDHSVGLIGAANAAIQAQSKAVTALRSFEKNGASTTPAFEGAKWVASGVDALAKPTVTWSFADSAGNPGNPFSGYISSQYQQTAKDAIAAWAAVSGIDFVEVPDSTTTDIRIGWGDFDTPTSGQLGYTSFMNQGGAIQAGAIIRVEDPHQTALSPDSNGQMVYAGTQASLYGVILHEIGHAIGLDDNSDPTSVMFPTASTDNRTLDATDVAGVQLLYGAPATTPKATSHTGASSVPFAAASESTASLNQLIQAMATFSPGQAAIALTPAISQGAAAAVSLASPTHH